jgi:hypothetical protein
LSGLAGGCGKGNYGRGSVDFAAGRGVNEEVDEARDEGDAVAED